MFGGHSRETDVSITSTPDANQAAYDQRPTTPSPPRGSEAFRTLETEPVPIVSQDRSPSTKMPLMPKMSLELSEIDAPPRFFLVTPAEICSGKVASRRMIQRDRLSKLHGVGNRQDRIASPMLHTTQAYCDDVNDMFDEEVAVACDRAYGHRQGPVKPSFKLRPKPLREEEEAWDPGLLFRS